MDRLILFRHGKAESQSPTGGDFERRLAPRGVVEAQSTARRLSELGVAPSLALVSPAARTRETWSSAQGAWPPIETRLEPGLYDAEADDILALAEDAAPDAGAIIVVGHNPGLQELTVALLRKAGAPPEEVGLAMRRFPTSAAAVFRFDGEGRPSFERLVLPPRPA